MIQRNDRSNASVIEIFVYPQRIMARIVDGVYYLPIQSVLFECFCEFIDILERKSKVGLRSGTNADMNREIVSLRGNDILIKGMPEVVAIAVRIISPVRRGVGVKPIMVTRKDSLFSTVAGRLAIWIRTGTKRRAITGYGKFLGVA